LKRVSATIGLGAAVIVGIAGCSGSTSADPAPVIGAPEWSYSGDTGPQEWGKLSSQYEACSSGQEQTPIDVVSATVSGKKSPTIDYRASQSVLLNNGHSIQLVPNQPENTLSVDGKAYQLTEMHFHSPSETKINGTTYDAEFHFVHEAADEDVAVLAIVANAGADNPAWQTFVDGSDLVNGDQADLVSSDLAQMVPTLQSTYRFTGSLTTPPCTGGLNWVLNPTPIELSQSQLDQLREAYYYNDRPLQALNGRTITQDN
jgi:carbonic anhydrase